MFGRSRTEMPDSYEDRYVAFIDILGWKSKIEKLDKNPKLFNEMLSVYRHTTGMSQSDQSYRKEFGAVENDPVIMACDYAIASDTLILSSRSHDQSGLHAIIFRTAELCRRLILAECLVRGGMTHGKLFHQGNIVFGKALTTAYFLESQQAIYPRVVIDAALMEVVRQTYGEREWALSGKSPWFLKDQDGMYFLNFLGFNNPVIDPLHREHQKLKEVLDKELEGKKTDARTRQKLYWMKSYLEHHLCAKVKT